MLSGAQRAVSPRMERNTRQAPACFSRPLSPWMAAELASPTTKYRKPSDVHDSTLKEGTRTVASRVGNLRSVLGAIAEDEDGDLVRVHVVKQVSAGLVLEVSHASAHQRVTC